MAKITRYTGNLKAPASNASANKRGVFGDPTGAADDTLDANLNTELLTGWEIVGPSEFPTLQDFNSMGFTLGQIHAYLHQVGVPEWSPLQEYYVGSITNVGGVLYRCLVDDIGTNPVGDLTETWHEIGSKNIAVFDAAGVTEWTVPRVLQLGLVKAKVTVIGGGAAGSSSSTRAGGGGGGGGIDEDIINLTGVTTVSVTVGDGSTGVSGSLASDDGELSSFGAFLVAEGGGGATSGGAGGISGVGLFGSVRLGLGGGGSRGAGGGGEQSSGAGASGGPGRVSSSIQDGVDAVVFGGGGSGSVLGGLSGAGKNGLVKVEW